MDEDSQIHEKTLINIQSYYFYEVKGIGGSSSVVELHVANVVVAGSNPVSRSIFLTESGLCDSSPPDKLIHLPHEAAGIFKE